MGTYISGSGGKVTIGIDAILGAAIMEGAFDAADVEEAGDWMTGLIRFRCPPSEGNCMGRALGGGCE